MELVQISRSARGTIGGMLEPRACRESWIARHTGALALAWGFAEATLFFIVPDVLITWIALRGGRRAWHACLWALAGALLGGSAMWLWGRHDPAEALRALDAIPAISSDMCARVAKQIHEDGPLAVLRGPIGGVPYKIYAVQAGAAAMSLPLFLAISAPARLARFIAIAGLTLLACRVFSRTSLGTRRIIHLALWTGFYICYFWRFGDQA